MNLRKQSRRYAAIHSWLESRLLASMLAGTVKAGDERYWRYNALIERSNELSCQYNELYLQNT